MAGRVTGSIEDPGDIGMLKQVPGLLLALKPSQYLSGVHSRLDDLQSHVAVDGSGLLGQVDHAVAAFPQNAQQGVSAELLPYPDVRVAVRRGRP